VVYLRDLYVDLENTYFGWTIVRGEIVMGVWYWISCKGFETLCETLQQGQFEDPEQPLHLFSKAIELFTEHNQQPLKAVQLFTKEVDNTKLKDHQKIFVYERVCKYLEDSEFEFDHTLILELLNSHKIKLEADSIPPQPMTKNIREILKGLMQKELEPLS